MRRSCVVVAAVVTLALMVGLSLALVGRHRALLAERQMRLQRDRAMQAESDTRVLLDLFNDKLSSGDEMIALLHASARIARERLGPTNPAVLKMMLSSAQNLGRLAAWTNALEVYHWLIETDPGNLEFWERAHAAALAAARRDAGRQLRAAMVKRFAANHDPANCLPLARTLLVAPEYQIHLDIARDCAHQAYQAQSNDLPCRTMQGLAAYRMGNWPETLRLLQDAEHGPDPNLAALASAFGAMARHRAGDAAGARAALDQVSRHLRGPLQMGQLQAKDWHETVLALAARAEAERLILGRASPALTAGSLALAREMWKTLHESLAQGEAFAREAKWKESRDAYARVLAHPLFEWTEAEERSLGRCLSLEMGAVFARCGDSANHERLCRLLLARHPEKPKTPKEESDATVMANRYARTCFVFARSLSPELRREALELARFALANQRRRGDHSREWVCQTAGIAEYYAGQPERAVELLLEAEAHSLFAIKGPAMLYRAMILKDSNRLPEAAQVLRDAELFGSSAELNMREWWFNGELYRLALEEARQLIRPEAN